MYNVADTLQLSDNFIFNDEIFSIRNKNKNEN